MYPLSPEYMFVVMANIRAQVESDRAARGATQPRQAPRPVPRRKARRLQPQAAARRLLPLEALGLLAALASCGDSEPADAATTGVAPTTTTAPTTTAAQTTTAAPTTTDKDQAGTVTEEDLVYATWEEGSLTLDMHVPTEAGASPIVIYLPGRGLSNAPSWLVEGLVGGGTIVFVVRVAANSHGPEQILADHGADIRAMAQRVACAIRFAQERASELGSDEPGVVLSGFSSGGGTAAHAALFGATLETRWDEYGAEGGPPHQVDCEVADGSTDVDALAGIAGPYDLFVPTYDGKFGSAYQQERDPELWSFLSNSIGANLDLKVRLLHGESDGIIPYENSVGFEAMLASAGYDVQLTGFDGGHWEPMDPTISTFLEVVRP